MEKKKVKLGDLLTFFNANNRYMGIVINIARCQECGKRSDKIIFRYRFQENFKMDYETIPICNKCFHDKSKYIN